MALSAEMELYSTPASRLDSFVAQCLQPSREWKEEVLEAVKTVEQSLREEPLEGECGLDQEVRVLKLVKVRPGFSIPGQGGHTQLEGPYLAEPLVYGLRFPWKHSCELAGSPGTGTGLPKSASPFASSPPGPSAPHSQPPPEVYVNLVKACRYPGHLSPSFCELQRDFVKHRPTKLKSLLRLVKHWFLQYVRARSPRAALPPLYALELLTIYAWEMGTQENESFRLDEGLTTVMELLQDYESLCIYWTKYYTFQNPIIEDVVRKQLQRERPIILDPADPTYNVAEGCRWDIVAQRACQCLKQDCCYDSKDNPVSSWNVKRARDIQVTVEQWGCPDWTLMVNPYTSIRKVKEKIQRRQCCEGLQRLSFQTPSGERKLLRSRSSLAEFGIFSDTRICLLETIPPEIQVFVRNPEGGSHAYAVDPNSFVLGLKQQIEDKQGLLRKQQELQFVGRVLQDWSVLGSYGIKDSDTLILSKKKDTHFPFLPS
ncbi:PREDICTED: 2'-5'-oligoadenylate synthase-like protein [Myotis davidii]|uniref:2'-5'-oligoadenylate synthase-like protein n=1 Tax=Myotis davidii TaxID=225400 RepID=UPI0003EBE294|nr:PREDICTED: 2'-5'-oligoadenylate synthase-like protein [Myotis davidii]